MKKITKVTNTTLASIMLAGGALSIIQPLTANAQETTQVKQGKNPVFEKGIINSFKDYNEKVGDHTIHYEMRKGSAHPDRTFILSHGAFGTEGWMKVVAGDLAQKYPNSRIILIDLPWHGQSVGPADKLKDATVYTYADIVQDFIQQKQADKTIQGKLSWIGWSMGGSIGMLLDLHGVDIDELTLLNSSAYWGSVGSLVDTLPVFGDPANSQAAFKAALASNLKTHISTKDSQAVLDYFPEIAASGEVGSHDLAYAINPDNFDIRNQLPNIKADTLILGGDQDTLSLMDYLQTMDKEIPNSELKVYKNDNHYMLVKPEEAQRIVNDIAKHFGTKDSNDHK